MEWIITRRRRHALALPEHALNLHALKTPGMTWQAGLTGRPDSATQTRFTARGAKVLHCGRREARGHRRWARHTTHHASNPRPRGVAECRRSPRRPPSPPHPPCACGACHHRSEDGDGPQKLEGRGLHPSTLQLNSSALYGIGGSRKGCVARVKGMLGGVQGVQGGLLCETRLKLS